MIISKKLNKLFQILRNTKYRAALLRTRTAAAIEHERLLRRVDCEVVVDVGANKGQFALVTSACIPRAKIFSFEPLEEPARIFREVFKGNDNVRLYQVAIAPKEGVEQIHVSRRDDSSSLLPILDRQSTIFPGTEEVAVRTIKTAPLENCLSLTDLTGKALLKLDVQGYELESLKGCESLLPGFSHVYVECSFVELYEGQAMADEVISWLRTKGFRLAGCYNMSYDHNGIAIQADFLFAATQEGE